MLKKFKEIVKFVKLMIEHEANSLNRNPRGNIDPEKMAIGRIIADREVQGIKATKEDIQRAYDQNQALGLNAGTEQDNKDKAIKSASDQKEREHWQKKIQKEKNQPNIVKQKF